MATFADAGLGSAASGTGGCGCGGQRAARHVAGAPQEAVACVVSQPSVAWLCYSQSYPGFRLQFASVKCCSSRTQSTAPQLRLKLRRHARACTNSS